MEKETRIVRLRSGEYALQKRAGYLSHWFTMRRFKTLVEARAYQTKEHGDEIVEVIT